MSLLCLRASLFISCLIASAGVTRSWIAEPFLKSNQGAQLNAGDSIIQETVVLSFEEPIRVGGPGWVRIESPDASYGVQYPVGIVPGDFGCHEFEVRRNGMLLPRVVPRRIMRMAASLSCGFISVPGRPMAHTGRLPLHLLYRFDSPGVYEVRYTRKADQYGPRSADALFRSAWTRLEVQPEVSFKVGPLPQDPVEILSDFLPSALGFPDTERLSIVLNYLHHPEEIVRQYAASSLGYWPEDEVARRLTALAQKDGPSDVVVEQTLSAAPGLAETMFHYLGSDNKILVRGAVAAASQVLFFDQRLLFTNVTKSKAQSALLAAAENIVRVGDGQTINNFAVALGGIHNERSRQLLWDFVRRRVAYGQSLLAITWHKDLKDLPSLAAILGSPVAGDPLSNELTSLPNALRSAYGAAATPVLEDALKRSGYIWVRTSCARELILENRPSGFAFVIDAIEQNQRYRGEMIQFVRDQFPELRGAGDASILAFLKQQAM